MNNSTKTTKSNAKLAGELTRLGFRRGISSWEKSDFVKAIETTSWLGTTAIVQVEVTIRNQAFRGNDWIISSVKLATKNSTSDKGFVNGQVNFNVEAQDKLFELLQSVRSLNSEEA